MLRCVGKLSRGVFALLLAAAPLAADDHQPTIFATAWGSTLAQDGTGFYNEIAADVLAIAPGEELYQPRPYRRAKVSFFNTHDACLYPSSLSALAKAGQIEKPEDFIESNGVFKARTHLFVRAGVTPPAKMSDLFGKTIAYPNGSVVESILSGQGARLISVASEEDKAEMLLSGRVDIISGMMPDTAIVFSKMKGDMPLYDPALVLYEVPVTFVCHKTETNIAFIDKVNGALATLSRDPAYRARMAEAHLALDVLARASGDVPTATEQVLNDLAPSAGGASTRTPKSRSGRRQPMGSNR